MSSIGDIVGSRTVHNDAARIRPIATSFRDWCAETGVSREVAEAALAHVVGGTEGAYRRSDLLAQRAVVMDAWAAYLTS